MNWYIIHASSSTTVH